MKVFYLHTYDSLKLNDLITNIPPQKKKNIQILKNRLLSDAI